MNLKMGSTRPMTRLEKHSFTSLPSKHLLLTEKFTGTNSMAVAKGDRGKKLSHFPRDSKLTKQTMLDERVEKTTPSYLSQRIIQGRKMHDNI